MLGHPALKRQSSPILRPLREKTQKRQASVACHGVMLWVSRPQVAKRRPQCHEGPPEVAADIKTFVVAVQHDDTAALKLGLPVQLSEHHDDACRIARDSRIVMNQGQKQLTISAWHTAARRRLPLSPPEWLRWPAKAGPGCRLACANASSCPARQPAMPARVPEHCPSASCTASHAATAKSAVSSASTGLPWRRLH